MVYYPVVTRVMPLTTIRRERTLPVEGEVLVHVGAHVEPTSVVARGELPGRYRIVNVAHALRVPPEVADKFIRLRAGQRVKARQVVARRQVAFGLLRREVRTPQSGIVAAVGAGRILLETVGETVDVRAYLPGKVDSVIPKLGVVVETIGALVQGVWGSGGESFGVLKVLADNPAQPLRARAIDVSSHGAVLVGGSTMDRDALQQALELQVRGIIIGSLGPSLCEMAEEMPFPIVTTEGVGQAPMAPPLFQLLRTNEGREAAVSGRAEPRWGAVRPEVIIPLPGGTAPPRPVPDRPLKVGVQVRVTRGPMLGSVGTVKHLPKQPMVLETGARVVGAIVDFRDGREQSVPLFNLELLG